MVKEWNPWRGSERYSVATPQAQASNYAQDEARLSAVVVWINETFFDLSLPACAVRVGQMEGCYGALYVSSSPPVIYVPPHMLAIERRELVAMMLHEVLHHWQHCAGTITAGLMHNEEFLNQMRALGLNPICDGDQVGQTIIRGGRFDRAFKQLRLS